MIKKWLEKIFGKFCKCEKKDPHLVLYEDIPEPEIKIVCDKHPEGSYKKTCPSCRATK